MVDRIDIGVGPRIEYDDPTDTSGFRYTGQETLSADQYGSQFVDFYSQSLDIPSLSEETGIDPTAPGVGEDIQLKNMMDTGGQSDENNVPDVLSMGTILGRDNVVAGESVAAEFGTASFGANFSNFNSYTDYLASEGMKDRIDTDMFKSFYEPIAKGAYSDINFGQLGTEATEKVTGLPGEVSAQVEALKKEGLAERISKGAPKAISGVASMLNPMAGLAMGVFTGAGATVKNAFGMDSFRPSGVPGVVADMIHAKQFQAIKNIQAAQAAYDALPASERTSASRGDTGFAMKMGNFGVVRDLGDRSYTGNMRGLSHVQMKELEALSKGIIPKTFRMDGGDTDIFGGPANQSIVASGGVMMSNNPMDGYITPNGRVSVPGMGGVTAGIAYTSQLQSVANKEGLSIDQVKAAKDAAQAGNGTFGSNIRDQKRANDAAKAKQVADERRADEDRAAQDAIAQRQKEAQDAWNRTNQNKGPSYADDSPGESGQDSGAAGEATGGQGDQSAGSGWGGMAQGGRVGMAAGGQMAAGMAPSGFIGAPPSQVSEAESVADNVNTQKEEGTFIINAAAVEFAGESDVMKMLKDAQKEAVRRGITVDNPERSAKLIDVALSQGEVTVAPHLVKIIGEDRLTKINNRGKPETQERIEENGQQMAAQGGFLENSQAYALGDKVKVYRGEPLDLEKVNPTDYGYGSDDVGKFHTPDKNRARKFAAGGGRGNQVILSRKVTMDQLFDGVEEAWKVQGKKKTDYFAKMPKKELDKNLKFIKSLRAAYASGERSVDSMVMFLQEQVFDGKSKIDFIETFKNDPLSGGKLLGRAIRKVATKAAPPIAILERAFNATPVADATLGDSFLNSSATPDFTKNKN